MCYFLYQISIPQRFDTSIFFKNVSLSRKRLRSTLRTSSGYSIPLHSRFLSGIIPSIGSVFSINYPNNPLPQSYCNWTQSCCNWTQLCCNWTQWHCNIGKWHCNVGERHCNVGERHCVRNFRFSNSQFEKDIGKSQFKPRKVCLKSNINSQLLFIK